MNRRRRSSFAITPWLTTATLPLFTCTLRLAHETQVGRGNASLYTNNKVVTLEFFFFKRHVFGASVPNVS